MGNRVPIDESELVEHVVDGIPDAVLRNQARIQGFESTDSLLKAFGEVRLRDRGVGGSVRPDRRGDGASGDGRRGRADGGGRIGGGERSTGDGRATRTYGEKRCFNCGAREHLSTNCPTRGLGAKCFECGKRGHTRKRKLLLRRFPSLKGM